jgi:hypothetical protein
MEQRPALTAATRPEDFRAFYWLEAELLAFCRQHGLGTAGGKEALAARIADFLATGVAPARPPPPRPPPAARPARARTAPAGSAGGMPAELSLGTRITAGLRCSQQLRAFFERELGPRFHFDGVMRDFVRTGEGRTLQEAVDAWRAARARPRAKTEIAPQFEYNRFTRAWFEAHPDGTRAEALAAWKAHRARRREG